MLRVTDDNLTQQAHPWVFDVAAEMMDLWVARPGTQGPDGNTRRYCYTKIVLSTSNAPETRPSLTSDIKKGRSV